MWHKSVKIWTREGNKKHSVTLVPYVVLVSSDLGDELQLWCVWGSASVLWSIKDFQLLILQVWNLYIWPNYYIDQGKRSTCVTSVSFFSAAGSIIWGYGRIVIVGHGFLTAFYPISVKITLWREQYSTCRGLFTALSTKILHSMNYPLVNPFSINFLSSQLNYRELKTPL